MTASQQSNIAQAYIMISLLMISLGSALAIWMYFDFEGLFEKASEGYPYIEYHPDTGLIIFGAIFLLWIPFGGYFARKYRPHRPRLGKLIVLSSILLPALIGLPGAKYVTDDAFISGGYHLCKEHRGHQTYSKRRQIYRWQVWVLDQGDCFIDD